MAYLCPWNISCDSSTIFHIRMLPSRAPDVTTRSCDRTSMPVILSWWPNLARNHNVNYWYQNNILNCRPTNYELLCWLVETPSRDFEHYRMSDDSRQSIVRHCHVRCRTIGFARWRFKLFECRRRMLQRHLPNGVERTQPRSRDCW